MKGRTEESIELAYTMADLDAFCDELGDQMYNLVFKEAFKHDRANFDVTLKLDTSSHANLMAIVAKYGNADVTNNEINLKLKHHVLKSVKTGIIQLPADEEERDRITKVLGNYYRLQLRIAQFKYFYLNYVAQNTTFNKEQAILALEKIRGILPRMLERTTEAATSKHSLSFYGIQLTKLYNDDAASLREMHDKLDTQCEKLLAFAEANTPKNPTNPIPAAEVSADAVIKKHVGKRKKPRVVTESEIIKNTEDAILTSAKKQAVVPQAFQDTSDKTLPLHPVLEQALDARISMLNDNDKAKESFAALHKVVAENKKTEQEVQAAAMKLYLNDQNTEQEKLIAQLEKSLAKKPGFIKSLKTTFLNFMDILNKAINMMIVIVMDELVKNKKFARTKDEPVKAAPAYEGKSSMTKSMQSIAANGGRVSFDPSALTIEHVISNTIKRGKVPAEDPAIASVMVADQTNPSIKTL